MEITIFSDEYFMREALKEANKAFEADEVPVGAVVVCNNKIIARAHNLTERLIDVTAHAEMQAITSAANFLNGKYLNECTLYVTLEPCLMCAGALSWAQLGKLVFGATDTRRGFSLLLNNVPPDTAAAEGKTYKPILHPKTVLKTGVLESECSLLIKTFFQKKR
jgi:tRNA(adenine34) deaminase